MHVNERCRRKEERSKQGNTNNKAKQLKTPKAVTFPKKNELPQVGLEPTTLYNIYIVYMSIYMYIYMLYTSLCIVDACQVLT